jgi:hypothetical protein
MTAAAELQEQARVRPAVPADVAFIKSTWLKHFRLNNEGAKTVPGPVYYPEQAGLTERLMAKSSTLVACHVEAPDEILGWACLEHIAGKPVLHFLYEKGLFRGFGVAEYLLDALGARGGGFYTHSTPVIDAHAKRLGMLFNPYLAVTL